MANDTFEPKTEGVNEARTTRREVLRRAGVAGVVVAYGGAAAKTAVAGVPQFRHKELKETLKIIQWSHFVPAYDKWFDNVYIKRWGAANDTEVIVDKVNALGQVVGGDENGAVGIVFKSSSHGEGRS